MRADNRDWLAKAAYYRPQKTAFVDHDLGYALSYAEADRAADHFAAHLLAQGPCRPGDRIALLAQDPMRTILLFFACQRLGLTLVPLNYRLSSHELKEILGDAEPQRLYFDRSCAALVQGVDSSWPKEELDARWDPLALIRSQDITSFPKQSAPLALILYTSGTTGRPKGVLITQEMLFWNSINTTMRLDLSESDSTLNFLPYFHTGAWNVLLLPLIHRYATLHVMARFDAERILSVVQKEGCTLLFGVPTTLRLMAEHPNFAKSDLRSLRFVITGGESMPIELIHTWLRQGIPVRQGYGLTEFGPNVFSLEAADALRKIGSIGQPNYYCEVAILDSEGRIQTGEAEGELLLKGPMASPGYWRQENMTRELFYEGWLRTGDQVRLDAEGYCYVIGRKKDMFISGGENIYPAEIEQALASHPGVREVAVIPMADAQWGERGLAFVCQAPGTELSIGDLMDHCRQRLARFKLPADIILLDALPRNSTGKLAKQDLKRLANERYATNHPGHSSAAL
jgi:fatty-acyl-CoA synthase